MADHGTPHFHNDSGFVRVETGSKEFMCIGALPPFDHPHIYLDMGGDNEIVCPYCSTLFSYQPSLKSGTSNPENCVWIKEHHIA